MGRKREQYHHNRRKRGREDYLTSAFGKAVCEKGYTVRSFRITKLLTDQTINGGNGSYNHLMNELTKQKLLILDNFSIKQIDLALAQDFLEVVKERRFHQKSLITPAQLLVKDWPSVYSKI